MLTHLNRFLAALCFSLFAITAYANFQCTVMNARKISFYGIGPNRQMATLNAMKNCTTSTNTANMATCKPTGCRVGNFAPASPTPPRGMWQCWSAHRRGGSWSALDRLQYRARSKAMAACAAGPGHVGNCRITSCKMW